MYDRRAAAVRPPCHHPRATSRYATDRRATGGSAQEELETAFRHYGECDLRRAEERTKALVALRTELEERLAFLAYLLQRQACPLHVHYMRMLHAHAHARAHARAHACM